MIEFDIRIGTPGLHHVRSAVRAEARSTVLPPDLFARYELDAFWQDPARLPSTIRIV
jgi:sulfotransferase